MMLTNQALAQYLDALLQVGNFSDYCPNGLQVEGKTDIKRLVTGVTASRALVEAAIAADADAILVHHGYFWRGESATLCGYKAERLKLLFAHNINLYAYHLPLDCHAEFGNNVQLAKQLDIEVLEAKNIDGIDNIFYAGQLKQPLPSHDFYQHLTQRLSRPPLHIASKKPTIQTLAWCTGAAHRYIEQAVAQGVDAFITGEASEATTHIAREADIHFFAAGHHATERYGVQALGQHLAKHFGIEQQFVDIDNPV